MVLNSLFDLLMKMAKVIVIVLDFRVNLLYLNQNSKGRHC